MKLTAIVVVIGAILLPQRGATQVRGTLQATATVVDTRVGFSSLQAVRRALRPSVDQRPLAEIAQVRVQRRRDRPVDLIVTIDYSRN